MQVIFKIFLIIVIYGLATYIAIAVWNKDIIVGRSIINWFKQKVETSTSWIVSKQKDAIYQRDKMVGRVTKFEVRNSQIYFEEIYNSNNLDLGKKFYFQNYILKFKHADSLTNLNIAESHKGRILKSVICIIVNRN